MNKGLKKIIAVVIIIVIGAACIFGGVKSIKQNKNFTKITAVITQVEMVSTPTDENEDYEYETRVKYTVNGKEYEEVLQDSTVEHIEGESIEVAYNPEKPEEVILPSKSSGYIFLAIGGVVTLIGLGVLASTIIKGR